MSKEVNKLVWMSNFEGFCPWLDMADSERSKSNKLREKVFAELGVDDRTVTCWVTQKVTVVKVAHILPDSKK